MGKVIAVSGKGGVGKTLVAALLVHGLSENKAGSILAIDADPDANLADALGVSVEKTIGNLREEISKGIPPTVEKRKYLEGKAFEITVEAGRFDLLSMGRPEGPGCYCALNHMLREVIDATTNAYDYTIIDAEAGLEHLSRRTTQNVDVMLVVTDASKRGLDTARRIQELARELDIKFKETGLVLNRVSDKNRRALEEKARALGIPIAAEIPEDRYVSEYDLAGKPLWNLPEESLARKTIKELAGKLQ